MSLGNWISLSYPLSVYKVPAASLSAHSLVTVLMLTPHHAFAVFVKVRIRLWPQTKAHNKS